MVSVAYVDTYYVICMYTEQIIGNIYIHYTIKLQHNKVQQNQPILTAADDSCMLSTKDPKFSVLI